MLRFGGQKVIKENFYTLKRLTKIWDVNADNIVISKLVETKTNSRHLIGYLEKALRPLVLIMPKMSGYIKTFKVEDGNKNENDKLIFFCIDDKKLLQKCKSICTKIEDLKKY